MVAEKSSVLKTGLALGLLSAIGPLAIDLYLPAFPAMVKEFTEKLAQGPTKAMALAKRAVNRALECDLDELLGFEADMQEIAGRSADYREGVSAFTEKRLPVYTGN